MADYSPRFPTSLIRIWKRGVALAAPVMGEKVLRNLMRTTDVLVAGTFSPATVAAVGLGDAFGRIVNRTGNGLGDATIALSSQDTGSEALGNRNEAITQSLLLAALAGVPFVAFGAVFSPAAIDVLGAEPRVVHLGGQYLAIIMVTAPATNVARVGVRAIQGTGDTRTPLYIRGFTNVLNIAGTVGLAFGLGPLPRLSVVGIALATAIGETLTAVLFIAVIAGPWNDLRLGRPRDWTIGKQIVSISLPKIAEGGVIIVADFPFNAVLLAIGTEANAAYHVGRRINRQLLNPIQSGFSVAANILVGQSLGNDVDEAYRLGSTTSLLSVLSTSVMSLLLFAYAKPLVLLFTRAPSTLPIATGFVKAYAIAGVFHAAYTGLKGSLRGGSDTRSPLAAMFVGTFVFLLGVSYLGTILLGYGVFAIYVAIVLDYAWRVGYLSVIYYRRAWLDYGTTLMEDRGSLASGVQDDN